ncbi:MAG: serine/threonine-protein kinase [Polyangiaceae bacterium]
MTRSHPSLPDSIGRYVIVRRLGQGAMGRVVLANDPVLDRHVAMKLLRDDLGLKEEHRRQLFERMRQEARASARIGHPNIVALFDMGEDPALGLYLVFEYVKGPTLKDRIGEHQLAPIEVATIARQLGSALTTAHEAKVLHRDIKPENVILAPTGAKIADFGIARLPESTLTRDGRLLGTPAYSSPEAISYGKFSPASDQFSLAATLYEAICANRAFPGDDAIAVATLITTDTPPPIAHALGLDIAVDAVLLRAMQKDPRERFPSCEHFGNALAEAIELSSRSRPRPRSSDFERPIAPRERELGNRTLRVVAGAATVGALLMGAVLHLTRGCDASPWSDRNLSDAGVGVAPESPASSAIRAIGSPSRGNRVPSRAESIPSTTRPASRDPGASASAPSAHP